MREDWEWLGKAFLAFMFAMGMGVLLVLVGGYIFIRIIFETFFGD